MANLDTNLISPKFNNIPKMDGYKLSIIALLVFLLNLSELYSQYEGVNFANVNITDRFWQPKIKKVATTTMDACIFQTEINTPRIRNFEKVARKQGEPHEGIYYDDSDVYKALEAMAYALQTNPDAQLEKKAEEWIDKIAAAQEPDGYLNTYYSLTGLENRWQDMERHEAYCAGHLFEAAVAYYQATGRRKLLDVAIRFADHIDNYFRLQDRPWVVGHQEIELALVKLYQVTENKSYLLLADWFLNQRGKGYGKGKIWDVWKDPEYCQDAVPVKAQKEITGHAVRAMYLYSGAADVANHTKDAQYMTAMQTVWEDVVHRNMYVTGGIGSSGRNEGFSVDYDLPNEHAYCETCASVGMVFWNYRMGKLTGNSQYIDVLERSLFNGALDGLSISGDRFFYGNPLASNGQHHRREWFGTACCPSNIARLVTSMGNYVYGISDQAIWINLFVENEATLRIAGKELRIKMETEYPWDGKVSLVMDPIKEMELSVYIRIPGWFSGNPVPGGIYRFVNFEQPEYLFEINGSPVNFELENGYAKISRKWRLGDRITWNFDMPVQKLVSHPEIKYNQDHLALQRGPIVYCVEGADNQNLTYNFLISEDSDVQIRKFQILTEDVIAIEVNATLFSPDDKGKTIRSANHAVTAIPFYSWANRGPNEMQVWLPTKIKSVKIK